MPEDGWGWGGVSLACPCSCTVAEQAGEGCDGAGSARCWLADVRAVTGVRVTAAMGATRRGNAMKL